MAQSQPTPQSEEAVSRRAKVEATPACESTASRRNYVPGELIAGRYELERLIGRGGMGEVWTAHNTALSVRQALKLIRADLDSAESTDRLLHEAQAAARLADPAIVRVFDFGKTSRGDPFIVMEYLEGEDLSQVIQRREKLGPIKAVRTLLPVIRALSAAHTHGIVHRDLKPENIFLARLPDGRVMPKLLDFGIAKLKIPQSLRLTSIGAVMGSPLYMSPEQARGEEVDERTDVWAMCVVLYEAISGRLPFSGETRSEVLRAAAQQTPENLSETGNIDAALWKIVEFGLSKGRETRWRSMQSLGRALGGWLLDRGVSEDMTGASIEMTWLRESPRSFFSNTLRPSSDDRQALGLTQKMRNLGRGFGSYWLLSHAMWARLRSIAMSAEAKLGVPRRAAAFALTGLCTVLALVWALSPRVTPQAAPWNEPTMSDRPPVPWGPPAPPSKASGAPLPAEFGPHPLKAPLPTEAQTAATAALPPGDVADAHEAPQAAAEAPPTATAPPKPRPAARRKRPLRKRTERRSKLLNPFE